MFLSQDLCSALDQANMMLQKDKEAVEQRLQHVKKERELLQKSLKQKPPNDDKVSLQVRA